VFCLSITFSGIPLGPNPIEHYSPIFALIILDVLFQPTFIFAIASDHLWINVDQLFSYRVPNLFVNWATIWVKWSWWAIFLWQNINSLTWATCMHNISNYCWFAIKMSLYKYRRAFEKAWAGKKVPVGTWLGSAAVDVA
jgi:hypothetical protein